MFFADFQREPIYDDEGICVDENPKFYEPIPDLPKLVEKVYTKMEEFNEWCVNSLMPALRHL